jgi:hypothetical protein
VVGLRAVRVELTQNLFQSSPLSRMKLVVLRKAGYVTTCCWRGMVLGWGGILVVVGEMHCALKSWCWRSRRRWMRFDRRVDLGHRLGAMCRGKGCRERGCGGGTF